MERRVLGKPIMDRLPLVMAIHEEISGTLAGGGSRATAKSRIAALRVFFSWVDRTGTQVLLESVEAAYVAWAEHLHHRQRFDRSVTEVTAHTRASTVAAVLNGVLGRTYSLLKETRIRKPKAKGRFRMAPADKTPMANLFRFGKMAVDLCEALTDDRIKGNLPVVLDLRAGQAELWSGLAKPSRTTPRKTVRRNHEAAASAAKRAAYIGDESLKTRSPLVNLRIEAELLTFIAQTGMNLQQAYTLTLEDYHYASHLDGYQVHSYKARRDGAVLFEIFSEYRNHFERYLDWRKGWFGKSGDTRLFPFVAPARGEDSPPKFQQVATLARTLDVPFFRPRALRKARVNWLLRELASPEAVAEMAQHDVETLFRRYAEPHPQVAMVEIARFHERSDPSFAPPAPGRCVDPAPVASEVGTGVPTPDCSSAAGCLFCRNHRDIDSSDHVWSLASFRHLKSIELSRWRPPAGKADATATHPAYIVVTRVTQKLKFFEASSEARKFWVVEALMRIEEGDYHPAWDGIIQLIEMGVDA